MFELYIVVIVGYAVWFETNGILFLCYYFTGLKLVQVNFCF